MTDIAENINEIATEAAETLTNAIESAPKEPSILLSPAKRGKLVIKGTETLAKVGIDQTKTAPKVTDKLSKEANDFAAHLNSGAMLVKNVKTGETKTVVMTNPLSCNVTSVNDFTVNDNRVKPKHTYAMADPEMVNVAAWPKTGGAK